MNFLVWILTQLEGFFLTWITGILDGIIAGISEPPSPLL